MVRQGKTAAVLMVIVMCLGGDLRGLGQSSSGADPQAFLASCAQGEMVQIRLKSPAGRVITGALETSSVDGVVLRPYRSHKDQTILYADMDSARRYQPPPHARAFRAIDPVVLGLFVAVGVLAVIVLAKAL